MENITKKNIDKHQKIENIYVYIAHYVTKIQFDT